MWDWDHPCFIQWVVGIWGGSTRSSHRNAGHVASLLAAQQGLLAAEVRNGDGQLHYVLRSNVYTRWSNLFYWRLGRVIASNILEPWYTLIIPVIMCLFLICWNPWWSQLKSRPMVAHHICCWNTPFILCVSLSDAHWRVWNLAVFSHEESGPLNVVADQMTPQGLGHRAHQPLKLRVTTWVG